MLQALLHGKLSREHENLEDVLTSNVFGLLRYIDASKGVLPFLAESRDLSANRPLHSFRVLSDVEVNWEFWPYWAEPNCKPCEPDVALRFEHGPQKWLICVEAKYRSGKSSLEEVEEQSPTDQLAREWVNLVSFARREGRQPFLVYLTTDLTIPEKDLADSLRNLKRHGAKTDPAILWLSWASLEPVLADALPAVASEVIIKTDLAALLHRLGLQAPRFTGITVPTIIATALWSFARE